MVCITKPGTQEAFHASLALLTSHCHGTRPGQLAVGTEARWRKAHPLSQGQPRAANF